MGLQILQYEFLGPVPLDEWGPPMERLVYLVLSRDQDRFNIVYAGECERTDEKGYFVQHPRFKCWAEQAGTGSLHLAILPMFDDPPGRRADVLYRIVKQYRPACNVDGAPEEGPAYSVRRTAAPEAPGCPCCGAGMEPERDLGQSTLYRCTGCGMSDTRLNP